jgi:hypothetical protein
MHCKRKETFQLRETIRTSENLCVCVMSHAEPQSDIYFVYETASITNIQVFIKSENQYSCTNYTDNNTQFFRVAVN